MLHIMICISRKDENGVLYLVINVILSSNDFSRFFTKKAVQNIINVMSSLSLAKRRNSETS